MSMKKWLIGIGIVGVLAIAFFWGGNSPKSSVVPELSSSDAHASVSPSATPTVVPPTVAPKEIESTIPVQETVKESEADIAKADKPTVEAVTKPDLTEPKPTEAAKKPAFETTGPEPSVETAKPTALPSQAPEPTKDQFLTEPVPEGKPKPVEWQDVTINKKKTLTATLSVTCKTILNHMSSFNKDKLEVLPADGIIYKAQTVTFSRENRCSMSCLER